MHDKETFIFPRLLYYSWIGGSAGYSIIAGYGTRGYENEEK
jgi:hypothetical protein